MYKQEALLPQTNCTLNASFQSQSRQLLHTTAHIRRLSTERRYRRPRRHRLRPRARRLPPDRHEHVRGGQAANDERVV